MPIIAKIRKYMDFPVKSLMKTIFALMVTLLLATPVQAGERPVMTGAHQAWKTYRFTDAGRNVCFISSQPKQQQGSFKKRGEVFFFITRWPEEGDRTVISISAGYSFKPGTAATVTVDQTAFILRTSGEMAWTKNPATDQRITEALQQGKTMTVSGTSARGTPTLDTYSLNGSAAALYAIENDCPPVKRSAL